MTQAFNDRTPLQRLLWLGGMAKAAGGKGVEETASGNPVVFTTDLAKPLSRLSLSLLPRQSGTGDPSPENIRPLLPWGEVGTWHGGKNIFKASSETFVFSTGGYGQRPVYTDTGIIATIPEGFGYALYYLFKVFNVITREMVGKKLVYSSTLKFSYDAFVARDANGNISEIPNGTIREQDVGKMLTLRIYVGTTPGEYVISNMQVEVGNTPTAYETPTITPHPVNLSGITPPVYGCELDLTTGEVWGTHVGKVLTWGDGTNEQSVGEGYKRRRFMLNNAPVLTGSSNSLSDKCLYSSNGTSEITHFYVANFDTGTAYVYIFMPNETSETEEITVVSKLQAPVLLATLTPQQISAIVGVNTVWSDADGIELTYLKKG